MVNWEQIVRAQLPKIGIPELETIDGVLKIGKDVSESLRRPMGYGKMQTNLAEVRLLGVLRTALQRSRVVRQYRGRGNQVEAPAFSILAEVEDQLATEEGQT